MSASTKKQTTKVDSSTVNTNEDGAVDMGDEPWVSPVMQAVLAGDPVIFDNSVGEDVVEGHEPDSEA